MTRADSPEWITRRVAEDEAAGVDGNACTAGGIVPALRRRAAALAAAESEHAALDASQRARVAEGRAPTPDDLRPLFALRERIRALRPYALWWRVETTGNERVCAFTAETFDEAEDGVIVGAHAIIDRRDPMALRAEVTETTETHLSPGWRDRAADHLAAVERLCDANGWEGATIARDGERWEP